VSALRQPDNYVAYTLEQLALKGDREAIVMEDRVLSGFDARDGILRYAGSLREAGLGPGDGVALFVLNSPEVLLIQIAIHFVGCRLVFVPPEPGSGELRAFVRQAAVRALVVDPAFAERGTEIAQEVGVPLVFTAGGTSADVVRGTAWSGGEALAPGDVADADGFSTLLYTGGTTGRPRMPHHGSSYYRTMVAVARSAQEDSESRMLVCTLMTHTSGHFGTLVGLMRQQTVVLIREFRADKVLSVMAEQKISTASLVTPMLYALLDGADASAGDFPELRTLYYTGTGAAPARLRQAIDRFGPVLHQIYGASESGLVTQLLPADHDVSRPELLSSCGRPAPGVRVDVRNEEGRTLPPGAVGELFVRGNNVMDRYWEDEESTADVLKEGWFRTGDVGYADQDGYLYLVDRSRDVIVTGPTADNVYSRLLDDFLPALPGVRSGATVGAPGEDKSETVHLFLVPEDDTVVDFDEVRRRVVEEFGELYRPASFTLLPTLPVTVLGKVDKKALRSRLMTRLP
jgi:fatty-acyl-CoA synthase